MKEGVPVGALYLSSDQQWIYRGSRAQGEGLHGPPVAVVVHRVSGHQSYLIMV